ncbi:thiol:disulfide oxidoreductase related to ResA [Bacillus sp. JCM 19047]|nr:thiol:disulfide oxidoreductase related to ResA [Bacillus sp. JCM 19047]
MGDFQNDVIVLNVWASWCEPCVREMPELMAIDDTNDTVDVVTVNMLTKEYRASDPVDFIEEIGLTLPVLFDEDGAFIREVEPSRLPMTFLLDSNLHIQDVIIGEVTQDLLMERIDTAFAN